MKPQTTNQRIYWDNRLVVETNKGMLNNGERTVPIEGLFIADAETVKMLLVERNEGTVLNYIYRDTTINDYVEKKFFFNSKSDIAELTKHLQETIKADVTREEISRLRSKIESERNISLEVKWERELKAMENSLEVSKIENNELHEEVQELELRNKELELRNKELELRNKELKRTMYKYSIIFGVAALIATVLFILK